MELGESIKAHLGKESQDRFSAKELESVVKVMQGAVARRNFHKRRKSMDNCYLSGSEGG